MRATAFFRIKDIKKDAHINAVGSHARTMHEIAPEIFKHATTVVDQHEAAFAEAGEIIAAIDAGLLDTDNCPNFNLTSVSYPHHG